MVTEREVQGFIDQVKQCVSIWPPIIFIHRPKNELQKLADIGISSVRRSDIILDLEPRDYSEGPFTDTQRTATDMWVFGKEINGEEIYIKLTISSDTNKVICVSFHIAERKMNFPLKN